MTSLVLLDGETLDAQRELWRLYREVEPEKRPPLTCNQPHRAPCICNCAKTDSGRSTSPDTGAPSATSGSANPTARRTSTLRRTAPGQPKRPASPSPPSSGQERHTPGCVCAGAVFVLRRGPDISHHGREVTNRTKKSTVAGLPPVWVATQERVFPFAPNIGFNRETD